MHSPHEVNAAITLKATLREAARYWEPRRIGYNLVLAVVVAAWFALTWPHLRPALNMQGLLALMFLALMANTCYCAAYLAEAAMQRSPFRASWPHVRWVLWLAGTLFAVALAWYWMVDEIYPYVGQITS